MDNKPLPEKVHARLLDLWLELSKIQLEIEGMVGMTDVHDEKTSLAGISDKLYEVYDHIGGRWS